MTVFEEEGACRASLTCFGRGAEFYGGIFGFFRFFGLDLRLQITVDSSPALHRRADMRAGAPSRQAQRQQPGAGGKAGGPGAARRRSGR